MKEKIKLIILIIIFVILLLGVSNLLNNTETDYKNNEIENNIISNEIKENITTSVISSYDGNNTQDLYMSSDNTENENVGKVLEVTEANFDTEVLKSDKKVLVDFYADWCGPCKILSPIVEEIAKENPDLKVVKINVDENEKLSYKYGANYIPLLVVIEDGKEVNRAGGAIPKEAILDLVR